MTAPSRKSFLIQGVVTGGLYADLSNTLWLSEAEVCSEEITAEYNTI